jgi:hypothetical protein
VSRGPTANRESRVYSIEESIMTTTLTHRRAIANSIAAKQGVPATQDSIDALWTGVVTTLNASPPAHRSALGSSSERSSAAGGAKPTQASADAMWAGLARNLNDEAGLATPARAR